MFLTKKVFKNFFFCVIFFKLGIVKRDEMVFREAKRNNISVAMLTSGGYQVDIKTVF